MKRILSHISVKLIAAALLLGAGTLCSAAQKRSVVIVGKDGSTHTVALGKVDRIEIGAGSLTLHDASGTSREHAYADVDRVLIGEVSTIIDNAVSSGQTAVWPLPFADVLNVGGVAEGSTVSLYDLRGNCVATAVAGSDSTATLRAASLAAGVYVLSYGEGKAMKVTRQ